MSRIANLTLRTKMLAAFGGVSLLMAAAGAFVLFQLNSVQNQYGTTVLNAERAAVHAEQLKGTFQTQHQELKNTFLRGANAEDYAKYTAAFEEQGAAVQAGSESLRAEIEAIGHAEAIAFLDAFDAGHAEYQAGYPESLAALTAGGAFDPAAGDASMRGKDRAATDSVNSIAEVLGAYADTEAAKAESAAATARTIGIAGVGLALVASLVVAFFFARTITRSVTKVMDRLGSLRTNDLQSLQTGISALAAGDLTVTVKTATSPIEKFGGDEVGKAAQSVNAIVGMSESMIAGYNEARSSLATLVGGVQETARNIHTSSQALGEASDQMASATGQIASAINEVTRSAVSLAQVSQDSAREVERLASGSQQLAATASTSANSASQSKLEAAQIGERIQLVASASQEVARSAEESRSAAQQGQDAVAQAVSSMESIAQAVLRASSTVDQLGEYGQQIGDIVKAIDEIAAQTNLLALNAAIEAARAGEQGRGFAVVAENVRNLAERSSESTKEIAALIAKVQSGTQEAVEAMAAGVKDVEQGREITSEAGKALESIIASVQQSAVQMQTIASDVQGLAGGADRIVTSAEQIATMAGESASGAAEMANGTSRVTDAIVQVSATSEETSASAEEVSASTEELSAQSEELAATANQMRDLAEALNAATSRFRVA